MEYQEALVVSFGRHLGSRGPTAGHCGHRQRYGSPDWGARMDQPDLGTPKAGKRITSQKGDQSKSQWPTNVFGFGTVAPSTHLAS